jgi:hypothetical protein
MVFGYVAGLLSMSVQAAADSTLIVCWYCLHWVSPYLSLCFGVVQRCLVLQVGCYCLERDDFIVLVSDLFCEFGLSSGRCNGWRC